MNRRALWFTFLLAASLVLRTEGAVPATDPSLPAPADNNKASANTTTVAPGGIVPPDPEPEMVLVTRLAVGSWVSVVQGTTLESRTTSSCAKPLPDLYLIRAMYEDGGSATAGTGWKMGHPAGSWTPRS